jgi:hypothetical protein
LAKFRVPTFNIGINIWSNLTGSQAADTAGAPRVAAVPANLAYGLRVNVATTGGTGLPGVPLLAMNLLLPALTDIRGPQHTGFLVPDGITGVVGDYVECPAGTGRWYVVAFVDDIGKGFANEHRTASIFAIPGTWAPPFP